MMERVINTAIIGFGLSGRVFHAPFIHTHPGFRLVTVVERNSSLSKEIYPEIIIARDFEELIADSSIELVVVATPNIFHFGQAKAMLEAGKHVVIEKPFTPSSQEADALIGIAEKTGKKIFVYHNRRWDGDFKTVQQVVYNGYLGEILEYEAHFDRYAPGARRGAWRDELLPAGGVLYDLGSHLVDQALVLFGMPRAVFADISHQRPGTQVDDCFEVHLYYNRLKVILKASVFVKEKGPHFILHGTKGSFIKYGMDPQEELLKEGLMPGLDGWGTDNPDYWGVLNAEMYGQQFYGNIETEPGNYMEFYNNVHDVIVKGSEPAVRPDEARNVIRIIEMAFESHQTGSIIDLA